MKLRNQKDWEKRVKECKHRAARVYPVFIEARRVYERFNKVWAYWENRAWEAQRQAIQATVVPPNQTAKSIERQKERIAKSFKLLSREDRKGLLEELREEI